jgi:hypothetical protein
MEGTLAAEVIFESASLLGGAGFRSLDRELLGISFDVFVRRACVFASLKGLRKTPGLVYLF